MNQSCRILAGQLAIPPIATAAERDANFQRFIQNASWNIAGKVFAQALFFVISILVSRYLGKEGLGLYATIAAFAICSLACLPPLVWFAVGLAPLMPWRKLKGKLDWVNAAAVAAILVLLTLTSFGIVERAEKRLGVVHR